ncbi:DMT family transporter [Pseudodonghicola flavimaris]|uniref:DMT family transporter n=1 Tax=Pseudodonghicola flavimaris TaxID=3050036 RepID=A0ABT7EYW7_9RHOB|nr:DMT family transporter [Pseudodonghicola flavimaris]MDK3017450.1 DMT family transporter [Pseudodonghicola flavimaris]
MRLPLLVGLVMLAFAANSLLTRAGVEQGGITPAAFAAVRVAAGAVVLLGLSRARRLPLPLRGRRGRRVLGALSLSVYMIGFSLAYRTLDAGVGALILFGVVQISIFALTALDGAPAGLRQMLGAVVAFGGLAWILWPEAGAEVPVRGAGFMAAAGFGWALYTLSGRGETSALAGSAANFLLALPLCLLPLIFEGGPAPAPLGLGLAVVSGALTSGLGYALWYRVVPQLAAPTAATVQLSVPVIALLAGASLLGEAPGWPVILGAVAVIGGIALGMPRPVRRQPRADR